MEITVRQAGDWQVWIHLEPIPSGHGPEECGESFIIGVGATKPIAIMDALAALEVAESELRTKLRGGFGLPLGPGPST